MRTREEIEEAAISNLIRLAPADSQILEVLLDIRDLLTPNAKGEIVGGFEILKLKEPK